VRSTTRPEDFPSDTFIPLFLARYRGMKGQTEETEWHRPLQPTHGSSIGYTATYIKAPVPIRRDKAA
jgi:hypothetical protein